jgi:hypothetical protein
VVNIIFGGDAIFNKRGQKLAWHEILAAEPDIHTLLRNSAVPITFSREDQWTSFSALGKFLLVLDPVVAGSQLTRVLIDGGSSLNLIFVSTSKKMGLNVAGKLTPSKPPFYRIVPGYSSTPIGTVIIPVTFGTKDNYQTEHIKIKVANFE